MKDISWVSGEEPHLPADILIRTRYRAPIQHARIEKREGGYYIISEKPERAVTPGQSVVFYLIPEIKKKPMDTIEMIGGGVIV